MNFKLLSAVIFFTSPLFASQPSKTSEALALSPNNNPKPLAQVVVSPSHSTASTPLLKGVIQPQIYPPAMQQTENASDQLLGGRHRTNDPECEYRVTCCAFGTLICCILCGVK